MKVLVLDNNISDLQAITSQLKQLEFDVLHSSSGLSATMLFQSYSPDIIVMDPDFPDVHGYEIVKNLREIDEASTPVLFVSHDVTNDDIIAGVAAGGEYLCKPINPSLLKAKLQAMQRVIVMKQRYVQMSEQLQAASAELKQFTHIDNLTGLISTVPILKFCFNIAPSLFISNTLYFESHHITTDPTVIKLPKTLNFIINIW